MEVATAPAFLATAAGAVAHTKGNTHPLVNERRETFCIIWIALVLSQAVINASMSSFKRSLYLGTSVRPCGAPAYTVNVVSLTIFEDELPPV